MNKIVIYADSVCDMGDQIAQERGVKIIPLHVCFGDVSLNDSSELQKGVLYDKEKEYGCLPKTAAVTPDEFAEAMTKDLDEGADILYIALGSTISSTFSNFNVFKEDVEKKYPNQHLEGIDSLNLSTGISLLILKACDLRDEGKGIESIKTQVEALIPNVRAQFVLDTLEYLYKGGRCSALVRFLGGTFKLHPLIQVNKGHMGVGKIYLGQLKNAVMNMTKFFLKEEPDTIHDTVFITYSAHTEDQKDLVLKIFEEQEIMKKFKHVYCTEAGAVVGTHCGPGTIGILYIKNKEI